MSTAIVRKYCFGTGALAAVLSLWMVCLVTGQPSGGGGTGGGGGSGTFDAASLTNWANARANSGFTVTNLNIGDGNLTLTTGSGAVITFVNGSASQTLTEVPSSATLSFAGNLTVTTNISSTSGQFSGNGAGLTNLNVFYTSTNLFVGNLFWIGTNVNLSLSTNLNFTGVANVPAGTLIGYGELTVKATGTVTVTNPASWYCNDGLTNRTITSGNLGEMSMKVIPGFSTNFIFTQHSHP